MRPVALRLGLVCISLAVISLMVTGTSYAEVDPGSVVAMWLFDEGSGDVAIDSTGNGNDAAITGAEYAAGKYGTALSFNGDDFAEAPTFDNLDGRYNTHSYMFWAKQNGAGSELAFNAGAARVLNVHFNESPNSLLVGWAGMEGDWLRMSDVWIPDEWHHVAVTCDGATLKAYMDGDVVGERADPGTPPAESGSFMMARFLGGGYFYNGLLDEIVVFDAALTEEDVENVMNKGGLVTAVSSSDKLASTWGAIKN